MKRVMIGIVLIACGTPFLPAFGTPTPAVSRAGDSATGDGSMSYGEHGDSVGLIQFEISRNRALTGSLLFAAEDHHRYPDLIVRMDEIERATFGRRTVRFTGRGALHDEQVSVTVFAFDGAGTPNPDRFSIKCTNDGGEVVLQARGELFSGDISVGESS